MYVHGCFQHTGKYGSAQQWPYDPTKSKIFAFGCFWELKYIYIYIYTCSLTAPPPLPYLQAILPAWWEGTLYTDLSPTLWMAGLAHWCLLLCLCKGLPKAATINHQRLWYGTGLSLASGIKAHDVIYTTMPLYHSAALMIGLHGCIVAGKFCFSHQASRIDMHSHLLIKKSKSGYIWLLACLPETVFTLASIAI